MNRYWLAIVTLVLVPVFSSQAYERDTHRELSKKAAVFSVLQTDPGLMNSLGLGAVDTFPNSESKQRTISELIEDGADFEDNFPRSKHHFYDPLTGKGLDWQSNIGRITGTPSPDWALEDQGVFAEQEYSFKDARDSLYKALTAATPNDRNDYFGRTFQSLGQIIHHLQDMAQPQHTRNDPHCDIAPCRLIGNYNPSRYEQYTQGKGGDLPFNTYAPVNAKDDKFFFTNPRSFWHTQDGKGIAQYTNRGFVSAGTNFDNPVYPSPYFDPATEWEANANELLQQAGEKVPSECLPPNPPCYMTFYRNEVKDSYRPTETKINDKASTWSVFDQDLKAYNKTYTKTNPETGQTYTTNSAFSLNRFNFDEAHKFLIPRAVAYSTGLLDYFFRGKLEAQDAGFTDTGIILKVKNAIDPKAQPAWKDETISGGDLVLAYEYKDANGDKHYAKSATATLQAPLPPGEASSSIYSFTLNPPDDAKELKYRVVYRGKLGQEENAIAVGQAKPVGGFLVWPNYTPTDGINGARVVYKAGGKWRPSSGDGLQTGNIDWKGWYVNGNPTKVLTWRGPPSRYFPGKWGLWEFDYEIYQNGEVLTYTPYPVLGAALTKDAAGQEWIVAICSDGFSDIVYKRPSKKIENSWDLYDPNTNPYGWQEIGRHDPTDGMTLPNRAWFFNGDGTEAQTMRRGEKDLGPSVGVGDWLYRLHIRLTGDIKASQQTREDNLSGITDSGTTSKSCGDDNPTSYSYNSVSTNSGRFIVAVDYQENSPVYATYSVEGNETYDFHVTYPSSSSFSEGLADMWTYTEKINIPGGTELILSSSVGERRASRGSDDSSATTYISIVTKQSQLHYLDLRYGLYTIYTTNTTEQGGPEFRISELSNAITPAHWKKQTGQTMSFLGQTLTVNENATFDPNPNPGSTQYDTLYSLRFMPGQGFACTTVSSQYGPHAPNLIYWVPAATGLRAVDSSKNLFVSESKLGNDPRYSFGTFNYFSGGDLKQIIPPAPDNAVYYDIGVIR